MTIAAATRRRPRGRAIPRVAVTVRFVETEKSTWGPLFRRAAGEIAAAQAQQVKP